MVFSVLNFEMACIPDHEPLDSFILEETAVYIFFLKRLKVHSKNDNYKDIVLNIKE